MGEGDDNSSLEWLPAGWRMEFKVRKSGRKDRCYIDPSNAQKFYSKPEVLRHLKNVGNNHPQQEESKEDSSTDGSPMKVCLPFVDMEAVSQDLPAGWIKKVKVTRTGSRIRKDSYYIDPVSGRHFRSMKEVFRYLDDRKMDDQNNGSHASKPEQKDPLKGGSGDHALHLIEPRKLRSGSNREVQKLVPENHKQNSEIKDLAVKSTDVSKLIKGEPCEKEKSFESISPVAPHAAQKPPTDEKVTKQEDTTTAVEEKPPTDEKIEMREGEGTIPEKKKKKGIKKEIDLPRRTSKRLAGVEVDLPQVLETPTRVRQAANRLRGEGEARCADSFEDSDISVERVKRAKTGNEGCSVEGVENMAPKEAALPKLQAENGVSNVVGKEHAPQAVSDALPKEQQGVADVPLQEHVEQRLDDAADVPLQEHVEQRLDDAADVPLQEHVVQRLDDALPAQQAEQKVNHVLPKEQAKQGVADILAEANVKQGVGDTQREAEQPEMALDSALDLWNDPCIEFAIKTLTGDIPNIPVGSNEKTPENSGPVVQVHDAGPSSCQDLPLGDVWADPCFEFAVKTLTGDLPTVDDTRVQTVFQQPLWSSKAVGSNGVKLPNYRPAEFKTNGAYR